MIKKKIPLIFTISLFLSILVVPAVAIIRENGGLNLINDSTVVGENGQYVVSENWQDDERPQKSQIDTHIETRKAEVIQENVYLKSLQRGTIIIVQIIIR